MLKDFESSFFLYIFAIDEKFSYSGTDQQRNWWNSVSRFYNKVLMAADSRHYILRMHYHNNKSLAADVQGLAASAERTEKGAMSNAQVLTKKF